jgi:hypothetical protein
MPPIVCPIGGTCADSPSGWCWQRTPRTRTRQERTTAPWPQSSTSLAPSSRATRDALVALAAGGPFERATDAGDSGILKDAFLRSQKDLKDREELEELTVLEGDHRRLVRGPPDPAEPSEALADLPANALAALPGALERYRSTLLAPPPAEHFQVLDAARVFGKGIASWPRVRILILVRGASHAADDDVILELREIGDSTVAGWYPPGEHYDSVGARIIATSRAAWARPDAAPLWGVTSLLGLPCQVRWESEGQKTLRVRRLVGQLGTAEAIIALGRRLGALQARVHGADASALWASHRPRPRRVRRRAQ